MIKAIGARVAQATALLLLWLGLLLSGYAHAGVLGVATLNPGTITVGTSSAVTVTVSIIDPAYLAGSANLQRLRADGSVQAVVGVLADDGLNGDAVAGDKIYTIRFSVLEAAPGTVRFQVSAGFRGELKRTLSNTLSLTVNAVSNVSVPNVVGLTQAAAGSAITGAGLVVGTVTQASSPNVPAGSVISQNPAGGASVLPGSAVNLVISSGPANVAVPNVVGLTQAAATSAITGAGLVVGTVTQANSPTVPAGRVISQNPAGGASVLPGSAVSLVISSGPSNVAVPNVVGLTQAAASSAITGAGLVVGTVTQASSPSVPAGNVISQNPVGGASVAPGSAVNLVVSSGPAQIAVPGLGGLTQAAASNAITSAGLTVGTITTQLNPNVPAGIVFSQNPPLGTLVAPGTPVSFVVSLGQATVPGLGGLTQAAASNAITSAGLVVGTITTQISAVVPAGIVISQSPTGGTLVAPGSSVSFVVSLGQSTVPSLGGLTQAAATSAITTAGLTVGTITTQTSAVPAGIVISQNPVGGTVVAPGTGVSFVVSSGPAPVAVPNVVGLTQAAASTAITGAGLTVGTITTQSSPTVPAGSVISQNPLAGASVAPGSAVNLVVSTGPANIAVPNVVNLTQAAAATAITSANLVVGTVTSANSPTVPAGSVISQNPVAGVSVPPGSAVNFVVSTGPAPVAVPNVVGLTQAAASSAITGAGLVVGTVSQANSPTVPAGSVISQNPVAGASVAPGSSVNLVVSSGPANVAVPNVVGLTQAAANSAIVSAGLVVGTPTFTNSATVPSGNVISQNPAAGAGVLPGSSVSLTVSVGPSGGPAPASIELQLGTVVVAAGGSTPITTIVRDASNQPIIPAPAVTYAIVSPPGNAGAVPTTGGAVLSLLTSANTRGAYTLQASVDGTAISTSVRFAVIEATPPAGSTLSNGERLVAFGTAGSTVADKLSAISAAFSSGQLAAIPALNTALQAAAATVPVAGRSGMERTTPVAPDQGFLPSTSLLISRGFPETAGDVAFGNLLTQIDAKVAQIKTFYATLDPASPTNDDSTLNQLNADLSTLLNQLLAVTVSPHGVVKHASRLNILLAQTIPAHLQALSSRINTVLVANQLASVQTTPTQFYADFAPTGIEAPLPEGAYRQPQPAFFGLVGLLAGSSLQMNLVNRLYGQYLAEVSRMMVLLAVNNLLQTYLNSANMEGIITGASLSFHIPNRPGSVIEGTGHNPVPSRNDVFFIGPDAVSAVQGVLTSFNPSNIKSFQDLYKFFDGIVSALQAAQEAYDRAHRLPSRRNTGGCILDFGENPNCTQLEYDTGFPDVNDGSFPSPVIVLVHDLDTGSWSQGIFNFVAN